MSRPSDDDRAAVDRAFADLVAGYHLTSDRPDPLREQSATSDATTTRDPASEAAAETDAAPTTTDADGAAAADRERAGWADSHPLFRYVEPPELPPPAATEDDFVPEPLMPLPRPAWPVLVAWIAMGYAVLAVLAAAIGVNLPNWAVWSALVGFIGGFALLVTRLPRHRDPDAGNGAVL
jgi:hypothetical protein